MSEAPPIPTINCTQCGAELHPDEGQIFLTCAYCSATVFVDKSQVVFHWALNPTLNQQQAGESLARWMSGNQTVKDLDRKAQVKGFIFQYFPLWSFTWQDSNGREQTALLPAAATAITELAHMHLPAGDLVRYETVNDADAIPPTVPLEGARAWLLQSKPDVRVRESALVHVPIYIFKYQFNGQLFTALVEAATGTVLANIFPAKSEAPYLMAGFITAAVFVFISLLPHILGAIIGLPLALVLGVIAIPVLFAFAAYVAAKV
ncbi:MAG TPA: hypothetical protein VFF78_07630 [Anaerolineaceae bacterium]|nr:hypothetical protein [Anaerolineaceae bacterium]